MSEIISFRLNPDNDDERIALDILARWEEAGVGIRQTIVRAVLQLDGQQPQQRPADLVVELRAVLRDSRALADALRAVGIAPIQVASEQREALVSQPALDDPMRGAMRRAMRTGLKV